jgi:hypothetical protein
MQGALIFLFFFLFLSSGWCEDDFQCFLPLSFFRLQV